MPQMLTFCPAPAAQPTLLGPFTTIVALELSPLVLALVIVGVPLIVNCDGTRIETELMLEEDCLGDVFVTVTVKVCVVPVFTGFAEPDGDTAYV
jgi:hypothetical protein